MKIVDPVCGMSMDEKDIFETSLYKGPLYYFCSKECKEKFERDPETLLGMKQAREKKVEEERSRALEKRSSTLFSAQRRTGRDLALHLREG